jgi:hypothetical protein
MLRKKLGAVIGPVAEHTFWRLYSVDQALRDWAIVSFTSRQ